MICTYLSKDEREKYTAVTDPDLNELFQEVREAFGTYYLYERAIKPKRGFFTSWFEKPKEQMVYTLYAQLSHDEVQIINFPRDWPYSINTGVPKSYIMTYFYGLLNGRRQTL
jgi:hypothetical protein